MSEIMTAKDLCLWYGDNKALKDINIAIPERSITALIGPSGCGKSTFLKTRNLYNRDEVIHTVKGFKECGLAATRRADQCRDALFGNSNVYIF